MIFSPLIFTKAATTTVSSSVATTSSNIMINTTDKIVDNLQARLLALLKRYADDDPEIKQLFDGVIKTTIRTAVETVAVTSTLMYSFHSILQSFAYYLALGDYRAIPVGLGLSTCELLGLNRVLAIPIVAIFTRCVLPPANQQTSCLVVESLDPTETANILTTLWQTFSIFFNMTDKMPTSLFDFCTKSLQTVNSTASQSRNLMLFFEGLIKVIKVIYTWFIHKIYGVTPAEELTYHNKTLTMQWAREVYILVDPKNERSIMNSPTWFKRLEMAVKVGQILVSQITKVSPSSNMPHLIRLLDKAHGLYVKAVNIGYHSSIRREPVCVWVAGTAGIGKTHLKDKMIADLLKLTKIKIESNPVYTHTSGVKHWTGVKHKNAVLFDDFSTVEGDILDEDIAIFMRLISDARFAPEQAAIEDKGVPVSPELVYVNCNESHPAYNSLRDKPAFYRRRHIVVEAVLVPEFACRYKTLECIGAREWVEAAKTVDNPYPHLKFTFLNALTPKRESPLMVYKDFVTELTKRFTLKYQQNTQTYLEKMEQLQMNDQTDLELPFEQILKDYEAQILRDVEDEGVHNTLRSHFSKIYTTTEKYAAEAMGCAKSLFESAQSMIMKTEADDDVVCTCDIYEYSRWYLGRAVLWLKDDKPLGFCGCNCIMREQGYWTLVDRAPKTTDQAMLVTRAKLQLGVLLPVEEEVEILQDIEKEVVDIQVVEKIPEKQRSVLVLLTALGIALGTSGALYYLYKLFSNKPEGDKNPRTYVKKYGSQRSAEVISSGDSEVKRLPKMGGVTIKYPKTENLVTEAPVALDKIIDRNLCYLVLNGIDKVTRTHIINIPFRCLGIAGTHIILLKHYISKYNRTENATLEFVNSTATCRQVLDFSKCKYIPLENSEVGILVLPHNINNFRDIRAHFMTEIESSYLGSKIKIYEKALGVSGTIYDVSASLCDELQYEDAGVSCVIPQGLTYRWHSPGRCMSVLYSTFSQNKIIGFHICGGDGIGGGEPIVRETLDLVIPKPVLDVEALSDIYVSNESIPALTIPTDIIPLGVAKDKYAVRPAVNTKIIPSLIHGYVSPKTIPAPLKPADVQHKFSPLVSGVAKHGQPPKGFPTHLLDKAESALYEQYIYRCKPARHTVGILSEQEAVCGIPGIDGYPAMELSTSEGFPYCTQRPPHCTNKRYQFEMLQQDEGNVLVSIDAKVRHIMEKKTDMRNKGIVPNTVFVDCLKDNRIKKEKFYVPGKTRVFSISPTDFTLQFKQYFGDILAAQKISRFETEHMVGLNINSLEWTKLARRVQSKGDKLLCGDYSNFGPGLDPEVVYRVGKVWRRWYRHHESQQGVPDVEIKRRDLVRRCMIEEIRFSTHLCCNIFYKVVCGAPSGAPCTVNLNNDVNKMYIYMAWFNLYADNPIRNTIVNFRNNCVMYVYGDDLIINISDNIAKEFNNEYLHKFFASYNIKYTDDTKSDVINKYCTIADAGFLKCKFKPSSSHPLFYVAALDKVSVEDCANWMRAVPDTIAGTKQVICDSLMLSFGLGPTYFDSHRANLLKAWYNQGIEDPLDLYTYEEMEAMRFGSYASIDLELAIKQEREFRERMVRELGVSSTIAKLIPENLEDPDIARFKKAIQRLRAKHRKFEEVSGLKVPAMRKILHKVYLDYGF